MVFRQKHCGFYDSCPFFTARRVIRNIYTPIPQIRIYPITAGEGTLAMPTFVNSATDIAEAFVRRQSDELFDAE